MRRISQCFEMTEFIEMYHQIIKVFCKNNTLIFGIFISLFAVFVFFCLSSCILKSQLSYINLPTVSILLKKKVSSSSSSSSEQNQHIWSPPPSLSLLLGLLFKNQTIKEVGRGAGCDWKIGSLFEWLAFTLMNLIWMEVHIKPHRFCTVILLIATEASLFVVLTPIQLKSHLEGNRLGSVNFMWKTPCD